MTNNLKKLAVCAVMALGGVALAQDAEPQAAEAAPHENVPVPSAEEVKRVWTYFQKGQTQGPIAVDARLCTEVAKEGPNKFECTVEVPADGLKAGTSVMLWQAYMIPQGDTVDDLMIQVKQGNVVRETKDVKVKGDSWRTRQWTGVRLNKPGTWNVSIVRGDQVLKSLDVTVTK
jgi:hypothetical protein